MRFEWDEKKNAANLKNHGIRFERAVTIFKGPFITRWDPRSYDGEDREISIGVIDSDGVYIVVHVDRSKNIRIISARKASKRERKFYYAHYHKKT